MKEQLEKNNKNDNQEFKEYSKDEIKNFILNNENLYFVECDLGNAVVREKDIPDFIIKANEICMKEFGKMTDITFYKTKEPMKPVISTFGVFINKIEPDIRKIIIDRLVKLQQNEIEPVKINLIDGNLFIEVDEEVGLLHERNEQNKLESKKIDKPKNKSKSRNKETR